MRPSKGKVSDFRQNGFYFYYSFKFNFSKWFDFHRDWTGLQTILHEMINATVGELLQPNENNLTPQSKD